MREKIKKNSKNGVILLLLVLLLVLTYLTWFGDMQPGNAQRRQVIGELFGGLFWKENTVENVYPGYEEYDYTMSILSPVRAAVRNDEGLTLLTGREEARELFERVSAVLASAMDSAGRMETLTAYQWRELLSGNLVFFDFEGEMPLDMLAAVIGSAENAMLEHQVRDIVLAIQQDTLTLAVMSKNGAPTAYTTAVPPAELISLAGEFGSGNAHFAFEDQTAAVHLPAEFIIPANREKPAVIRKSSTFADYTSTSSERIINAVLESFGYNPYTTGSYIESDDTRVYVEELSTLRLSPDGSLSYYAPDSEKMRSPAPNSEERSAIIMDAAAMLDSVVSDYIGDVTLYIQRAYYDAEVGRYVILFGCVADGIVLSFPDGYFARLEYAGTTLASAHLTIASYILTAQHDIILPDPQAAALVDGKCTLFELRYVENQNGEYHANWYCIK